jgi:hypothetical protein
MKKYLTFPNIIRLGLVCVFLTNSLTAFYLPSEFIDLVSGSFAAGILSSINVSVSTFVTFVGFNDMTVAILLLLGWRTSRVATYAVAWFIGVICVIGVASFESSLDVLEHLAFVAMALSLSVRGRSE